MATTEIQRVPGAFRLPADWPRLEFPDTETGLLVDWDASTLPLGSLATAGWEPAAGKGAPITVVGSNPVPEVRVDASGHKFLQLNKTRLRSYTELASETTILVVLKPTGQSGAKARILTGNLTYRGLYLTSGGFAADVGQAPGSTNSTLAGMPTPGVVTATVGRYGNASVDVAAHGKGWSLPSPVSNLSRQSEFTIGSNTLTPPTEDGFLVADLYRVQIWNRVLTRTDVEAVMQLNAARYGF